MTTRPVLNPCSEIPLGEALDDAFGKAAIERSIIDKLEDKIMDLSEVMIREIFEDFAASFTPMYKQVGLESTLSFKVEKTPQWRTYRLAIFNDEEQCGAYYRQSLHENYPNADWLIKHLSSSLAFNLVNK